MPSDIHHYDVKTYECVEETPYPIIPDRYEEAETIRGLTLAQKETVMSVLDREGVYAQASAYDGDGRFVEAAGLVNAPSWE